MLESNFSIIFKHEGFNLEHSIMARWFNMVITTGRTKKSFKKKYQIDLLQLVVFSTVQCWDKDEGHGQGQ